MIPDSPAGGLVIGGDYQGLGIARSLGRHGIPVAVIDDEPSIAGRSRFVAHNDKVASLRDATDTVATLLELGRRRRLQGWVLFPTREETVAAISQHRSALLEMFRVPTPAWPSVLPAWDKRETYALAERLDVPTPRCWFPRTEQDLAAVDHQGPVIVKPAIKEHFFYETKAKAWRADSPAELVELFGRASSIVGPGEVIVQELIRDRGEGQVAFCALFKDQQALAAMTVRRRRQHPSDFGRASTFVETVDLPELEALSLQFLRAIDYYGLVELEFKQDPEDGRYKLLDVNPRTWGYHSLGGAAGVDFPYLLFRDQTGLPVSRVRARAGVRWIRLLTDLPNAARDIRRRRLKLLDYLATLRGIHTEAVMSFGDPLPGLYELALLPYLAARRGL